MAVITKFFHEIEVPSSGAVITNIIEQQHSGFIDQIIIRDISGGGATSINVEVRYNEDQSTEETLVYLFDGGNLPVFTDSTIHANFSLRDPDLEGKLSLFLEPDSDAVLEIRIDFEIDRVPGAAS